MFTLSKQIDTDEIIAKELPDRDLFNLCIAQPDLKICNYQEFWKKRTLIQYPRLKHAVKTTWKDRYLYLSYWKNRLFEEYGFRGNDFYSDPMEYYNIFDDAFDYPFHSDSYNHSMNRIFLEAAENGLVDLLSYAAGKGARNFSSALTLSKDVDTVKELVKLSKKYSEDYTDVDYLIAIDETTSDSKIAYLEKLLYELE